MVDNYRQGVTMMAFNHNIEHAEYIKKKKKKTAPWWLGLWYFVACCCRQRNTRKIINNTENKFKLIQIQILAAFFLPPCFH